MFGGKREKMREEELSALKEENARQRELLLAVESRERDAAEQFARMTIARTQVEEDMEQIQEHMHHIVEMAESGAMTAGELHNTMVGMNNGMGTFWVNHSVFTQRVREQNEKVMEIVENNKHFTTPMKCIAQTPVVLREEQLVMQRRAARMTELSKSMGVLSLNAAIEAGRMGESGSRFVAAAEEIRSFSESYEQEAIELSGQLEEADVRIAELEEQVHYLNELLKENNISMGRLYKDCVQNMAAYEGGQIDLRNLISEDMMGRADALQQSERENARIEERILLCLGDIRDELLEHKSSADELERIYKGVQNQ